MPNDEKRGPLDPGARRAAELAPPPMLGLSASTVTTVAPTPPPVRVSVEELVPQLVRRIAWTGDRRKGTVQMELGAGTHSGTTVTVHADGRRVRVELTGTGDLDELRARIDARLRRHGLDVESVTAP